MTLRIIQKQKCPIYKHYKVYPIRKYSKFYALDVGN